MENKPVMMKDRKIFTVAPVKLLKERGTVKRKIYHHETNPGEFVFKHNRVWRSCKHINPEKISEFTHGEWVEYEPNGADEFGKDKITNDH